MFKYLGIISSSIIAGVTAKLLSSNGTIATGAGSYSVAVSADGTSVYVANGSSNNISEYSRNTSTGALTAIGTIATGSYPASVAVSADGTSVYVANYFSNNISEYSRN